MKNTDKILELVTKKGFITPAEIERLDIPRQSIYSLCKLGKLVRIRRGVYSSPEVNPTEYHTIAEVMTAIPRAVLCLISALQYHELTTQLPYQVWIAIDRKSRKPRADLPVQVIRFSGLALSEGIETHTIEGVQVNIYSPAKTVADCFKYRNKIGLDIALEALKDCYHQKKATIDQIWEYAKICRVTNIMKPYIEAII